MNTNESNMGMSQGEPFNWRSLGFFSANDYLIYIFKKTEKITSALYLVSGLLKDDEPMKWELRDRGMDLLNSSFNASNAMPGDKNAVIQTLLNIALETISLLNVAKISNLISDMNHTILVGEIDNILKLLKDKLSASAESAGLVLSESFFKTSDMYASGFKHDTRIGQTKPHHSYSHAKAILSDKDISNGQSDLQIKKSQRQENIIGLLKKQSNLTIKDFAVVIKDCSEKTIQRELLDLVGRGVVKKEGERRWSRYSLS